ncbi:MAG: hypothetical protein ACREUU_06275, partial [Gammaproteobacteria bacterium]
FLITRVTEMGIKSQIARPRDQEVLKPGRGVIEGAVWAGRGNVERVEVSVDAGQSWKPAVLGNERLPYAWTFWKFPWEFPDPGRRTILARAFNDGGQTQPVAEDRERINRYDNRWIHRVGVAVEKP